MTKSKQQFPFGNGMPSVPGFNSESFAWMSNAFSEWLHNTNRVQAEVIRFMGERFSKDVKVVSRFAECRNPEDFMKVQTQVISELASDYQQEGSRMLALFGESSKDIWGEFTRASGAKTRE